MPFSIIACISTPATSILLRVARLLLHDTKQMVDRHGSHGYAHSGMLTEALTVAPPRGHSVNIWLPWLTTGLLDPLASLEDALAYGHRPDREEAAGGAAIHEFAVRRTRDCHCRTIGDW